MSIPVLAHQHFIFLFQRLSYPANRAAFSGEWAHLIHLYNTVSETTKGKIKETRWHMALFSLLHCPYQRSKFSNMKVCVVLKILNQTEIINLPALVSALVGQLGTFQHNADFHLITAFSIQIWHHWITSPEPLALKRGPHSVPET